MEQYISKSAVVAEIESRIKSLEECFNGKFPMSQSVKETEQDKGKLVAYKSILPLIDSFEVKEVDLEKEIQDIFQKYKNGYNGLLICKKEDFSVIAKHFFELGMAVSNKEQKGDNNEQD